MSRMLLLMPYLPPPVCGGSGVLLRELCTRFPEDEVTALVGMRDQNEGISIDGNMTVIRKKALWLPLSGLSKWGLVRFSILWLLDAVRLHHRNKFSYVLCGEYFPAGVVAMALNLMFGIPYFIFFHGEDIFSVTGWSKWLLNKVACHAKGFVANSDNTKGLITRLGVNEERIIVCKPCVDYERFRPMVDAERIKQELGLDGTRLILTVARLMPRKGHKLAITSLKSIVKKYPNAKLVVIGQDFGYEDEIRKHIRSCEMEDNIVIKGVVSDDDLVKYYQVCDVFIMVSDTGPQKDDLEGFGITFLEANACEKPVVGGNTGGMPEAIEDGVTGFTIDASDEKKLVDVLDNLLGNQTLSQQIGRDGRNRVLRSFDYGDRARHLREELLAMLKQPKRR